MRKQSSCSYTEMAQYHPGSGVGSLKMSIYYNIGQTEDHTIFVVLERQVSQRMDLSFT